ncbi:MAG: hypothetical protein AAFX90_10005 [Pseudomonadota bacterium]
MGWKAVKDHYKIGHYVAMHEGKGICIGSGYIHDIIRIDPEKKTINWGKLGPSHNDDLARYWSEIHADLDAFWRLVEEDDQFTADLPVYTYEGGKVVEYACEQYGWPNVTHDGQMMYENTFFEREEDARKAGIRNAEAGVESLERIVAQAEKELEERRGYLAEYRANLASLQSVA